MQLFADNLSLFSVISGPFFVFKFFFFFVFFFGYSACNRNVWQLKVSCSVAHRVTVVVCELKTGLSHEIRPPTTWTSAMILYKCSNVVKHSKSNCRVTCYNTFMTLKSSMKSLHYSYKHHLLYYRDFVSLRMFAGNEKVFKLFF